MAKWILQNTMTHSELPVQAKAELTTMLGVDKVLDHYFARAAYAHDASFYALMPQAVVQAQTLTQIQGLFQWSQKHAIPICFRAAGTSLSGQAVSSGVLVDISKDWREFEVKEQGLLIRAQPGVIGGHLNRALRPWYRKNRPGSRFDSGLYVGGHIGQ